MITKYLIYNQEMKAFYHHTEGRLGNREVVYFTDSAKLFGYKIQAEATRDAIIRLDSVAPNDLVIREVSIS